MAENHSDLIRSFLKTLLAFVHLILICSFSTASPRDVRASSDLDETELLQLKKGNTIVHVPRLQGQNKGTVEAIILIDAPAAPIWRIMTDCKAAPTFVPGLVGCQVLDSGDNWEIIRHDAKWIWFFPKVTYVFRAEYQINRQIDFNRIRGDLSEMNGSWRLEAFNNGKQTMVRYRVYLDPGFFIPQWIVQQSLKQNLPAVLVALRSKVQNSN